MRVGQRLLGLAATVALGGSALVAAAAPAQAAACSGTNGVTVVVQSSEGTSVRCASGDPSSAWAALQGAGHGLTPVARFPDAVCRIDGFPASDPCINMPPASAYWSFWHAPSGGSWTYSQIGIKGWDPKPGSSVGFRFGSGSRPSVAPATASAPAPTTAAPRPTTAAPKPTTAAPKPTSAPRRTTSAPRSTGGATGGTAPTATRGTTSRPATTPPATARSAAPKAAASATAPSTAATAAAPTATPSAGATAPASTNPSTPSPDTTDATDVVAAPPQDTGTSGSGRLVGGGALLAGLAAAVAVVAVRRRTLE